jgi:proteasome assembly chaperone (PAC2) family protein
MRRWYGWLRARLTFPQAVMIEGLPRRVGLRGRLAFHIIEALDRVIVNDAERQKRKEQINAT